MLTNYISRFAQNNQTNNNLFIVFAIYNCYKQLYKKNKVSDTISETLY